MLLGKQERLIDLLLRLFERQPSRTAKSLHHEINSNHRKCSLVAVYKELNKLLDAGIVVKAKDRYIVSLTWTLELMRYSESLYSHYLSTNAIGAFLPREGEKLKWSFSNLIRMDQFWVQLMFALYEASSSRDMYEWVPHLWFPLVDVKRDLQYLRAMKIAKNRLYLIVGGDTFLDRLPAEYWDKEVYTVSHAKSPFESERERYYCLIDNYILTVRIPAATASEIDRLFETVASKNDLDIQEIYRFLELRQKRWV